MCKPVMVGTEAVEAHMIGGITYAHSRRLVTATGGLMLWDDANKQAYVRTARAPLWDTLSVLWRGNEIWPDGFKPSQLKLDYLWTRSLAAFPQVDPLLMVAILGQEGTGSFDTNPNNADEYNGNGPDRDWQADVARAVGHVAAKIRSYRTAVAFGFVQEAQSVGLEGNVIQFVNWPGPLPEFDPTWGPYAQHGEWWSGVLEYYTEMGGNGALLTEYALYLSKLNAKLRCKAVTDNAAWISDVTGTVPSKGVVTFWEA